MRERYERRYIPDQRQHFGASQPRERADVVIENSHSEQPEIIVAK